MDKKVHILRVSGDGLYILAAVEGSELYVYEATAVLASVWSDWDAI
jgi:hypothetical protein